MKMDDSDSDDELLTYFMKAAHVGHKSNTEAQKTTCVTDSNCTTNSATTDINTVGTELILINHDAGKYDMGNNESREECAKICDHELPNTHGTCINNVTTSHMENETHVVDADSDKSALDDCPVSSKTSHPIEGYTNVDNQSASSCSIKTDSKGSTSAVTPDCITTTDNGHDNLQMYVTRVEMVISNNVGIGTDPNSNEDIKQPTLDGGEESDTDELFTYLSVINGVNDVKQQPATHDMQETEVKNTSPSKCEIVTIDGNECLLSGNQQNQDFNAEFDGTINQHTTVIRSSHHNTTHNNDGAKSDMLTKTETFRNKVTDIVLCKPEVKVETICMGSRDTEVKYTHPVKSYNGSDYNYSVLVKCGKVEKVNEELNSLFTKPVSNIPSETHGLYNIPAENVIVKLKHAEEGCANSADYTNVYVSNSNNDTIATKPCDLLADGVLKTHAYVESGAIISSNVTVSDEGEESDGELLSYLCGPNSSHSVQMKHIPRNRHDIINNTHSNLHVLIDEGNTCPNDDNSDINSSAIVLKYDCEKNVPTQTTLPITLDEDELNERVVATTLANIGHDDSSSGAHALVEIILLDIVEESAHAYGTGQGNMNMSVGGSIEGMVTNSYISGQKESNECNSGSNSGVNIVNTLDNDFKKTLKSTKKGKENTGNVRPRGLKQKAHSSEITENNISGCTSIDKKLEETLAKHLEADVESPDGEFSSGLVRSPTSQCVSGVRYETGFCKHLLVPDLCAICKLSISQQKPVTRKVDPLTVDRRTFDKFEFQTSATAVRFERKHDVLTRVVKIDGHSMETEILPEMNRFSSERTEIEDSSIHGYTENDILDIYTGETNSDVERASSENANMFADLLPTYGCNEHYDECVSDDNIDVMDITESIMSEVQYDWEKQAAVKAERGTKQSQTECQSASESQSVNESAYAGNQLVAKNNITKSCTSSNYDGDVMTTVSELDSEHVLQKTTPSISLTDKSRCQTLLDNIETDSTKITKVVNQTPEMMLDNTSCTQVLGNPKIQRGSSIKKRPSSKLLKVKIPTSTKGKSKQLQNSVGTEIKTNTTGHPEIKLEPIARRCKNSKKSKTIPVTSKNENVTDQESKLKCKFEKSQRLESIIIEKFKPLISLHESKEKQVETKSTFPKGANESQNSCISNTISPSNKKKYNASRRTKRHSKTAISEVGTDIQHNKRVKVTKKKINTSKTPQSFVSSITEQGGQKRDWRAKRKSVRKSKENKVPNKSKVVKMKKTTDTSTNDNTAQNTVHIKSQVNSVGPQPIHIGTKSEPTILDDQMSSRSRTHVNAWKDMLMENAFNMSIDDCVGRKPVNIKRIVRKILGKPLDRSSRRRRDRSRRRNSLERRRNNTRSSKTTQIAEKSRTNPSTEEIAIGDSSGGNKHVQTFEQVVIECKTQTASDFPGFHFQSVDEKGHENKMVEESIFNDEPDLNTSNDAEAFARCVEENTKEPHQKEITYTLNEISVENRDGYVKPSSVFEFQKRLLSPSKPREVTMSKNNSSSLCSPFSESSFNSLSGKYKPDSPDTVAVRRATHVLKPGEDVIAKSCVNRVLQFPGNEFANTKSVTHISHSVDDETHMPPDHSLTDKGSNNSVNVDTTGGIIGVNKLFSAPDRMAEKCTHLEIPSTMNGSLNLEKRTLVGDGGSTSDLSRRSIGTSLTVFEASSQTPVFAERQSIQSRCKRTVDRRTDSNSQYFKRGNKCTYAGVSTTEQGTTTALERSTTQIKKSMQKRKRIITDNVHSPVSKVRRRTKVRK